MSRRHTPASPHGSIFAGAALLAVLCCVVGPAVLDAAVGGLIGGWFGVVCAVVLIALAVVLLRSRRGRGGC